MVVRWRSVAKKLTDYSTFITLINAMVLKH